MFKQCLNMKNEVNTTKSEIKEAIRWGNGAGVLLPKEWTGKLTKVTLLDPTEEIQKETLNILKNRLSKLSGIYLTGSYARNEQDENSDIDILVISEKEETELISGKYNISIIPEEKMLNINKKNVLQILTRIMEAKTILNNMLIEKIKENIEKNKEKINEGIEEYLQETKEILKINRGLLTLDNSIKIDPEQIYSIILRTRGIFIIKCILNKKIYKTKNFKKWILKNTRMSFPEIENVIEIYQEYKLNQKIKEKEKLKSIKQEKIIELLNLLDKEVIKLQKEIKD